MTTRHESDPSDALLALYREAAANDSARPAASVRDAVRARAATFSKRQREARGPTARPPRFAANDRWWSRSLVASLAVAALSGLLFLQFDRGDLATSREAAASVRSGPAGMPSAPGSNSTASMPASPSTVPTVPREVERATPTSDTRSRRVEAAARSSTTAMTPAPLVLDTPEAESSASKSSGILALHADPTPAPAAAAPPSSFASPAAPAAPARGRDRGAAERSTPTSRTADPGNADEVDAAVGLARTMRENRSSTTRPSALARDASIDTLDADGRSALLRAALGGDAVVVRRLLIAGADPTLRDREGADAAALARRGGFDELARTLEAARNKQIQNEIGKEPR